MTFFSSVAFMDVVLDPSSSSRLEAFLVTSESFNGASLSICSLANAVTSRRAVFLISVARGLAARARVDTIQ